jgi:phosphopantetheine adenylyltransferase
METKSEENSKDYQRFKNLLPLQKKNSTIFLTNLNQSLFDHNDNENNLLELQKISKIISEVFDITENICTLKIYLTDIQNEENLLKKHFRTYDLISTYFYSTLLNCRFLDSKKFYISFPQLTNSLNKCDEIINYVFKESTFDNLIVSLNLLEEPSEFFSSEIPSKLKEERKSNYFHILLQDIIIDDVEKSKIELIKAQILEIQKTGENNFKDILPFHFENVALGGTFDHSHIGHNVFLTTAFLLSSKTINIGMRTDEWLKSKGENHCLQPYNTRLNNIRECYEHVGSKGVLNVFPLSDVYGGTQTREDLHAIILTEETIKGGQMINEVIYFLYNYRKEKRIILVSSLS